MIIENQNGGLSFKGLGRYGMDTGKCFVEGDVLFMSNKTNPEIAGGEEIKKFQAGLCGLPLWDKTKYYIPWSHNLHICKTGRRSPR